jgi:hypothetical protein
MTASWADARIGVRLALLMVLYLFFFYG